MKIHFNEDGTFDADGEPEEVAKLINLQRNEANGDKGERQVVFLRKEFIEVLECFRSFPEGLTSPQVAEMTGTRSNGTASSRCNHLAKMGLIVRRNGHNGYQITPEIAKFDIRTTKIGK